MTGRFFAHFKGTLPLFVLAHFAHHLLTALPVPLLPMIRNEFHLDYTQSGLVISAFSLSYGIAQLPAGWLTDRIGKRIMVTLGILGVAFCGVLIGLSNTFTMIIVFLALMGLLGGCYHPAASPAVSESVEPANRGKALGVHLIGGSASFFLAPLIAVAIAASLGWRGPFLILAVPAIIFGAIFYIAMAHLPAKTESGQKLVETDSLTTGKKRSVYSLIVIIVLSTFVSAILNTVTSFIPLFMVDRFGVSMEAGGAFVSIIYAAGLWAGVLGGYLSDRFGSIRILLVTCFAAGFLIYCLNVAPSELAIGAVLLLIGMFMYMRMPVTESYIIDHTSQKHRSSILGIYYFSGMEGNGVITPLVGYMADHIGFNSSFTIVATSVLLVSLVCSTLLLSKKSDR